MGDVGVVLAAGGRGRRMGGGLPKQFLRLGGTTILERAIRTFARHPQIDEIVIVVPRLYVSRVERLMARSRVRKVRGVVAGGNERQESVRKGLDALSAGTAIVLVHDAVRPLISVPVITAVIRQARRHGAAVVATQVRDTIKREGKRGFVTETVPRFNLWAVQTPQGFRRDLLVNAHRRAVRDRYLGTDECSLVERLGVPVRIVPGETSNLKITAREDLLLAGFLLRRRAV